MHPPAPTDPDPHGPTAVLDLFQAAVLRDPGAPAVEVPPGPGRPERRCATYGDLDRRARTLAAALGPRMARDALVAIFMARDTPDLYAAQLAALMAGGAWTCLEPAFPDDQVRAVLADGAPVAILADAVGAARLRGLGVDPGLVLEAPALAAGPDPGPLPVAPWLRPDSLAYLIYTSGTTGRPKGVMIARAALARLVQGDLGAFGLGPGDRVAQGSSAAYDSSVEETWLALASGATVVVLDDAAARLGPDLVPWLRRERITVFCPPPTLLRATGCEDPGAALPDLKLLYVGGEPLPRDVADRWAPGRRLVNGYGPTEATVTALRGDVTAGAPITIGRPVPGMRAWILDGGLAAVPPGEPGELCLGGPGLALGYRNQPGQTALKFLEHPKLGRIYRTGDLARQDPDGTFHHLGRLDAQVKLRGYRIELEAIEARLAEHPGVREAACTVQGEAPRQLLAAFVVPEDSAAAPPPEALKAWVRQALPPYMVPARIGTLRTLPSTVGGKLDRRRLPPAPEEGPAGPGAGAATPEEAAIARAWAQALGLREPPPRQADFFGDLGGDSLGAAMAVSLLREDPATAALTVRDLYEAPTVAELALRVQPEGRGREAAPAGPGARPPLPALVAQTAWLGALLVAGGLLGHGVAFGLLPALAHRLGLVALVLLAPLMSVLGLALWAPLALALAVLVKRVLIGRYRPLRAPVWGSFFVRNWMVQQVVRLVPWGLLEGTELHCVALRALGARIGRRVHIHRGVLLLRGGWDLLDLGDDASLGQDAALQLVDLEAGTVVVGPVVVGPGATLEPRASLDAHTTMGPGACLTALSHLPAGRSIPAGERWHGIPAQPAGQVPPPAPPPEPPLGSWAFAARLQGARGLVALGTALPADLLLAGVATAWPGAAYLEGLRGWPLAGAAGALVAAVPLTVAAQALACRLLGPVAPGVIGRWSPGYVRVWLKTGLLDAAGQWLSGTLFWPPWLRLAGMKVGPGCEISTILDTVPELVEIGPETFFADGIYLGGPRVDRGTVTLAPTVLGPNTFLGNHAVIPAGVTLPGDILLGVCTVADPARIRPGSSWFGHPPFELPRREVVACDRALTHDPSWIRYLNRVFWEALRWALPLGPAAVFTAWALLAAQAWDRLAPGAYLLGALPLLTLGASAVLCLAVLALKWALLGRVKPGQHPLWSCWCSRWDFLYVAWGVYARPSLASLEGTLWLTWYLRAMGLAIGRGAVLGPGFAQVVDPDMIAIGDHATVQAMFQAHTFEDRVLKIDQVRIGAGATLGHGTVPLYGAVIGDHAGVAPHSVILKREHLLPGRTYAGAPTRLRTPGD